MLQREGIERTLELSGVLKELVKDGLLSQKGANLIGSQTRSREQSLLHPLAYIASQQAESAKNGRKLDIDTLSAWLAESAKLPLWHIDPLKINVPEVTAIMSFEFAKRHNILCVAVNDSEVVVATSQPYQSNWVGSIEQTSRKAVRRVVTNPVDLEKYTLEFYSLARSVHGAGSQQTGAVRPGVTNLEQLLQVGGLKDPDAQDQHIVNIVDWLLQYAFEQRASDIHIEPRREKGKIRFRIDGVLHLVYELPAPVMTAMVSRLKILGRMNVAEKRRPQDGRIKTQVADGPEVELRLSTLPTAFGEKMVMRIFDPEVLIRSFTDLGLSGRDLERWDSMTTKSHGIVLVTGPTGSGKTTTLYSTLKQLATEEVNVSTIEDPIEMVESAFNQTQVQHNIDFDFATGIRTLMRQDPDIIMVGEIRDLETAQMAVQAALTGHLVLSTLHTNNAPTAITRLLDLGVPAHLIKVTMNGVMAQRLVRTLCPHCKEKVPLDEAAWQQLISPWKVNSPDEVYEPAGCLECRNTGYLGRQGLYEIMPMSDALRALTHGEADLKQVNLQAMKEGMHTLRLSGAQKVIAGITSIAEVLRVTPDHSHG